MKNESLDIVCTQCNIKPSEVNSNADVIVCRNCIRKSIINGNSYTMYMMYGKYPLETDFMNNNYFFERVEYLKEVKTFLK